VADNQPSKPVFKTFTGPAVKITDEFNEWHLRHDTDEWPIVKIDFNWSVVNGEQHLSYLVQMAPAALLQQAQQNQRKPGLVVPAGALPNGQAH